MSEHIYWRDETGYVWDDRSVDGFAPEHWQRVHVLTDAELAAEKARRQAEARRVAWNVGFVCGVAYQSGDNEAWRNPYAKGSDDDR